MFCLSSFRLRPGLPGTDEPMLGLGSAGRMEGGGGGLAAWGGAEMQQAELKAAPCQPVSYWDLITWTPMKKLLEGN